MVSDQVKLPDVSKCEFSKMSVELLLLLIDLFAINKQGQPLPLCPSLTAAVVTTRPTYIPALFTSREPMKEVRDCTAVPCIHCSIISCLRWASNSCSRTGAR